MHQFGSQGREGQEAAGFFLILAGRVPPTAIQRV